MNTLRNRLAIRAANACLHLATPSVRRTIASLIKSGMDEMDRARKIYGFDLSDEDRAAKVRARHGLGKRP